MAIHAHRYTVGSTTPIAIDMHDGNNRAGMTIIIQNPHSENRHLLLGGADLNTTDKRGHELIGGQSLQITAELRGDDRLYAMAESGTGLSFTVLELGI